MFIDFFVRNKDRVNSNMVVIGKSGSGKSYATKTILANLAADNSKIFILDPENEYYGLAENLNGKIIDVGSATQGRLNPFHIISSLSDEGRMRRKVSTPASALICSFWKSFTARSCPASSRTRWNTSIISPCGCMRQRALTPKPI